MTLTLNPNQNPIAVRTATEDEDGAMSKEMVQKLDAIEPSDLDPQPVGDAPDPGTSTEYSRADHVHEGASSGYPLPTEATVPDDGSGNFTIDGSVLNCLWQMAINNDNPNTLTINTPYAGEVYKIRMTASGGAALTMPSNIEWRGGRPFTPTQDGVDLITLVYADDDEDIFEGSFFSTAGSPLIDWPAGVSWEAIYTQIAAAVTAGNSPTVVLDGSFEQVIPSGSYTAANINATTFFSPYEGGFTMAAGAVVTGSFVVFQLVGVAMTVSDSVTQANAAVNLQMEGLSQVYNQHASNAAFPQVSSCGLRVSCASIDERYPVLVTEGGVIYDLKATSVLDVNLIASPGGLTGNTGNRGVIGGNAGSTVRAMGDGLSLATVSTTNLADGLSGSPVFVAGYPQAYPTVLAKYTTGTLPSPVGKLDGYMVLDTTVPAVAVVISGAWKKAALT